jgi:hypothetical protein
MPVEMGARVPQHGAHSHPVFDSLGGAVDL